MGLSPLLKQVVIASLFQLDAMKDHYQKSYVAQ